MAVVERLIAVVERRKAENPKAFANFSPGFIPWGTIRFRLRNSGGVGQLFQSSRVILLLSQGRKPWAEIGERLRRSSRKAEEFNRKAEEFNRSSSRKEFNRGSREGGG